MSHRGARFVGMFAAVGLLALVMPVAASAVGPGTWTKITTPSHNVTFHYKLAGPNQLTVSGQTSPDVTSVDVDCIVRQQSGALYVGALATNVAVTSGFFSVSGTVNGFTNCRLRAVPSG